MLRETDPKKRKAQIERLQAIFYEDIRRSTSSLPPGVATDLHAGSSPYVHFWNAWLTK